MQDENEFLNPPSFDEEKAQQALNYVVYLLSRREYSAYELSQKLQNKDYEENFISYAIAKAQEHHWQSDERFVDNYLYSRANRGYGLKRIRQELVHLKGISESTIETVLTQQEDEERGIVWREVALDVLRKKFPHFQQKLTLKDKQKIWQYMATRGFSTSDFSAFLEASDEEIESYLYDF